MTTFVQTDRFTGIPAGAIAPINNIDGILEALADPDSTITDEERIVLGYYGRETLRVVAEGLNQRAVRELYGPNDAEQDIPPYSLDGAPARAYPGFEPFRPLPSAPAE